MFGSGRGLHSESINLFGSSSHGSEGGDRIPPRMEQTFWGVKNTALIINVKVTNDLVKGRKLSPRGGPRMQTSLVKSDSSGQTIKSHRGKFPGKRFVAIPQKLTTRNTTNQR